jgi:transcriptional regulator with GAF, ATPase, and Fis domain
LIELSAICRSKPAEKKTWVQALEVLRSAVKYDAATLYTYTETRELKEAAQVDGAVRPTDYTSKESTIAPSDQGSLMAAGPRTPSFRSAVYQPPDQQDEFLATVSVPLLMGDRVVGVLSLGRLRAEVFDELDRGLLSLVADLLAGSMQTKAAVAEIQERERRLAQMQVAQREPRDTSAASERLYAAADLATSINHQINNPLAVIIGNIQCLLLANQIEDEKTLSRFKVIEKAALKIADVNKKLVNINRLAREVGDEDGPGGTVDGPQV